MSIEHLEVIVEEPSMEAALRILLPRILEDRVTFCIYNMGDKQQLLARLPHRLKGYSRWLPENWRILVLVDRDRDDCRELKDRLEEAATQSGLVTRSQAGDERWKVANRIVIEELEAWFFGDPEALRSAYPKIPRNFETMARYRDPDAVAGGTWEAMERELQKRGYFKAGLTKIELARDVAARMVATRNRSRSFQVFHRVLLECAESI